MSLNFFYKYTDCPFKVFRCHCKSLLPCAWALKDKFHFEDQVYCWFLYHSTLLGLVQSWSTFAQQGYFIYFFRAFYFYFTALQGQSEYTPRALAWLWHNVPRAAVWVCIKIPFYNPRGVNNENEKEKKARSPSPMYTTSISTGSEKVLPSALVATTVML